MYLCTYEDCGVSFKKKWRLVEHLVKHTGIKPFSCGEDGCGKSFGRQSHLQRHMKNHLQTKDYQCPEEGCLGKFASREALNHHVKRVHTEKPFKCPWPGCYTAFKKHQQLKVHTYEHDSTPRHVCDYDGCGKVFPYPNRLKAHKKTHEGYACDVPGCEMVVHKWTDLRKHKHSAHRNSFPCDKCDKAYDTKSKLKNHSKIHEEDREVFECPYENCLRSYTRVTYLQQHVANYHEGARPYACSHEGCVKTFAAKKSLIKHKVVHEPGYCKPPSNPKRKRSLASRLSGFPDEVTHNVGRGKKSREKIKGTKKKRVVDRHAECSDDIAVTGGCVSNDSHTNPEPNRVVTGATQGLPSTGDESSGDYQSTEADTESDSQLSCKNSINVQRTGQCSMEANGCLPLGIDDAQANKGQLENLSQSHRNNESNHHMVEGIESGRNMKKTGLREEADSNVHISEESSSEEDQCVLPKECEEESGLHPERNQQPLINIQLNNNFQSGKTIQPTMISSKTDRDCEIFHELTEVKALLNLSSVTGCHTDRLNI